MKIYETSVKIYEINELMIINSPGLWPRACQSTYWIYCIRVLLILGGPRGTLGGVLDAPHLRCGASESVAAPKTPQDALRCNFFELRYPSPLGGIFAAPRLRRGGPESVAAPKTPQDALRCDFFELRYPSPLGGIFAAPRLRRGGSESVAAPKTTQDAPRCDFIELSGPPPSWTSKNRSWASRRLQDLAKMGPKLEAKIISFGRPSWHPFGVGVGAPGRRRAFFWRPKLPLQNRPPPKKIIGF